MSELPKHITDEEYTAACKRMHDDPSLPRGAEEHPFSSAVRAFAKATGIKHVVWCFAHEWQEEDGACEVVAGTTAAKHESMVLAMQAYKLALTNHDGMLSKWLHDEKDEPDSLVEELRHRLALTIKRAVEAEKQVGVVEAERSAIANAMSLTLEHAQRRAEKAESKVRELVDHVLQLGGELGEDDLNALVGT
jgi:hypothetical protein